MAAAALREPAFRAVWGLPPSRVLTMKVPAMENRMPTPAMTIGSSTRFISEPVAPAGTTATAASTMAATMAPT